MVFPTDEELLGIGLNVLRELLVAAAQGNEDKSRMAKVAETAIGDIPAEHVIAYFVAFMAF